MNQTLPQMIVALAADRRSQTALRRKVEEVYQPVSWQELGGQIDRYGRGLLRLGLARGDRVALMAPNAPEWVFADLGTMAAGGITVPIYHTEGIEAVVQLLADSGSRFLFVHRADLASRLLQRRDKLPQLERLILLCGSLDHEAVLGLEAFLAAGEELPPVTFEESLAAGRPEELATLIYTSGTTGVPKGVRLSHRNILANIEACRQLFDIGAQDECLSFLPLSHVFERVDGCYFMLRQGAVIAYAESLATVAADMLQVRPTVMVSVPRLYEKIYARVLDQVQAGPRLRRLIFGAALQAGRHRLRRELAGRRPGMVLQLLCALADRLVFSRLRQRLGGRLRYFISGGAPLNPEIAEFFLAARVAIFEGYGLTESAGGIAVNTPGARRLGSVGRPFPGVEVRLADDGEILLRGAPLFDGYWQRPEETREAFTSDGWFRTGDIGRLDPQGFLAITDRKKDIIVTASGENIAPQFLENRFRADPFLANALVYGDRKPYLTALLVPQLENLNAFARENGIETVDACQLVDHPRILQAVREHIDRLQEDLTAFQRVKRFTLLSGDFSRQELTPTLKLRRNLVQERYRAVLEGMYQARGHGIHDSGLCIVEDLTEEERD